MTRVGDRNAYADGQAMVLVYEIFWPTQNYGRAHSSNIDGATDSLVRELREINEEPFSNYLAGQLRNNDVDIKYVTVVEVERSSSGSYEDDEGRDDDDWKKQLKPNKNVGMGIGIAIAVVVVVVIIILVLRRVNIAKPNGPFAPSSTYVAHLKPGPFKGSMV